MKKLLITLFLTVFILVSFSGCLFRTKVDTGPVALTFYGLDDSDVFAPLISKYREDHPTVTITYKKFNDAAEYENLIVNEIAEGEGPDVFYIHNTWLPRHIKKIVPLSATDLTPANYPEYYVNVTADDFIQPDPADNAKKIYALPLYVDTLALYYNKKLFEQKLSERGKPASNWEGIKEDAAQMRVEDEATGALTQGIMALGRADNIKLAKEIFYNFLLQAGIDFYDAEFKRAQFASKGQEVFDFFMSFANSQNKNYSWSADLVAPEQDLGEVEAFLTGKVASILAYSDLYQRFATELRNVGSRNTSVIELKDIAVMPAPQIATEEADYKVWADYYGLAVSRNAKNSAAAWDFVRYLTRVDAARAYHGKTKRPTARRDMIDEQKKEPIIDVFVSQLGFAGSYRIFSDSRFGKIIEDAINSASSGQTSKGALSAAETAMNEILKAEAPKGMYPAPPKKK